MSHSTLVLSVTSTAFISTFCFSNVDQLQNDTTLTFFIFDSKVNVMVSTLAENLIRPILKFGSQKNFIVVFFKFLDFFYFIF